MTSEDESLLERIQDEIDTLSFSSREQVLRTLLIQMAFQEYIEKIFHESYGPLQHELYDLKNRLQSRCDTGLRLHPGHYDFLRLEDTEYWDGPKGRNAVFDYKETNYDFEVVDSDTHYMPLEYLYNPELESITQQEVEGLRLDDQRLIAMREKHESEQREDAKQNQEARERKLLAEYLKKYGPPSETE